MIITFLAEFGVPYDGSLEKEFVTVHPAISAIFSPISLFGIGLSTLYLVLIAVFRKNKYVMG